MTGEDDRGKRRPPGGFERPRRPFDGRGLGSPAGPTRTPGGVRVASTQLQGWSRDAGPAGPHPRCPLSAPGTGSHGARRPGGSRGPQQLRKELNRGLQVAPLGPAGLRGVKSAERGAEGDRPCADARV